MSNPFPELEPYNTARARGPLAPPKPTTPAVAEDWLAQEMRRERDQQLKQTIVNAPGADQVARATVVARKANVEPLFIDGKLDQVEKSQNADALAKVVNQYPILGTFLSANPRTAIAAQDDHQSLGLMGRAWEFVTGVPGALQAGVNTAAGGLSDLYLSIDEFILPYTNPSRGREILNRRERESAAYAQRAAAARPKTDSFVVGGLLQGIESVPTSLTALGVGLATRSPGAAAGFMGVTTGAPAYRDALKAGKGTGDALRYGVEQGGVEALTELMPASRWMEAIVKRTPVGKTVLRQLEAELPGEQLATALQDFSTWVNLNPDKPFSSYVQERPQAALSTALATISGTTAQVGAVKLAQRSVDVSAKLVGRVADARQAKAGAATVETLGKAAQDSKLNARDPESYAAVLKETAAEHGIKTVHIDGAALKEYMQSDGYDRFSDTFSDYSEQIDEAAASGGDVILPVDFALGTLPKTAAWGAIKDDIRLTAGGMSAREATTFEDAMADHLADLSDRMDRQDKAQQAERTAREKLTDSIALKLGDSYTAPTARTMAEVTAQYLQTRAARTGVTLKGDEFDTVDIKQVLPEALAAAKKADATDLVINALRKGKSATSQRGQTLAEWIAARGGVNDTGGDLASMGLGEWHKGKVGRRKLLRDFDPNQGAFGGVSGEGDFGIDSVLRSAIEAGFFPDLAGVENEAGPSTLDTQALLDALSGELTGQPRYAEDATVDPMRAAAEELREMMSEAGFDPDAMSDADVRAFVERLDEQGPEGGFEQEARARVQFDQGRVLIELFQARNLSSYFHEFGHMALENLRADAEMPDAPEQLKADWQTVQGWFAANGHPVTDSIPTDAHELWARGVERYLMEGKAPSPALKRIFETIRSWMVSIYKTIDRLRSPITPEIREVMDRLIATDEEIEAARERQGLEALFKDAAEIGMSDAEFAAYQQQVDTARAEANSKLVDKTLAAIRARETKKYRENRRAVRDEIEAEVLARPLYKALANLKASPLNEQWVRDNMGADALGLLPKRVPPIYRPNGSHPDGIAEMSGYATGREMLEALIGAELQHRQIREGGDKRTMRERTIETETDAEMEARYGDPLGDGTIEREALAAVHNDMQGEVIASEIRVLARKANKAPTPYQLARDWARNKVRSGKVVDEASPAAIQRYARAAARAGKAAEAAMLERNADEAFRQKQFQMLNNALVSEAKAALDEIDTAVKRMERLASRKTLKSVDQDYLEQAQALMEAVELRQRSQVGLDRQGKWAEWAQARAAEGYDVVVPDSFEASLGKTHYTRLSVENLLSLDEAVKQVIHLGRLKQTLLDNKERREFEEVVSEAVEAAGNIGGRPPSDLMEPSFWDRARSRVAAIDASLLKMETVFDWLDGGNSNGVFNRIVFRPIAEAQHREQAMTGDLTEKLNAALAKLPQAQLKRWGDKFTDGRLLNRETGNPFVFTRDQLVSMALNFGNSGNITKLTGGYGWNADAVKAVLDENLTAEEWAYVQEVWDTIDSLWPAIEGLEKRLNGIAPEKVIPLPLDTPHGPLAGGYFPVVYDPRKDYASEENAAKGSDLFENLYTRATTPKGFTKERTKVERPIHLSLGVINRHVGEVVHDITHREAIMQADKFLTNRRVMKAIDETLGPEVRKNFRPWLQRIANEWAYDKAGLAGLQGFIRTARMNATIVGMGFRVSTAFMQAAGFSNSFEVVGERWVAPAIARAAANPMEAWEFVSSRSGEVVGRMNNLDRDIRDNIRRAVNKGVELSAVKRFAFHGIGYMDRLVVVPTWLGAYDKAIASGLSEDDAIYAADKAVRQSQGAGSAKDLAAVQSGRGVAGETLKLLTMFYSYMSAFYQRERTLGRDIVRADKKDIPRLLARAWWLIIVPPLLSEMLAGRGPDDDEDESWASWAAEKILLQLAGPVPVVRDALPVLTAKAKDKGTFGYRFTPATGGIDTLLRLADEAERVVEGKETKALTRTTIETVGYFTGLTTGQIASSTQFLVDVGMGDADPDGFGDWWEGLTKGKIKAD